MVDPAVPSTLPSTVLDDKLRMFHIPIDHTSGEILRVIAYQRLENEYGGFAP